MIITGSVVIGPSEEPLPGVGVSNGRDIVTTGFNGEFEIPSLESGSGRWVMISTPAGYRPVDGWFINLSEELQKKKEPQEKKKFRLELDSSRGQKVFTAAQITDLHMGAYPADWLAEDLAAIANSDQPPQCILSTGDATQSGKLPQVSDYLSVCEKQSLPIIHLAGNHDWTDKKAEHWMQNVGPTYFSLDWGPVHIVALDSTAVRYNHVLGPAQEEWLAADLGLVPYLKPIVLLVHDQLDKKFYDRWSYYNIVATLSGHWHSSRLYHDGETLHINQSSTLFGGIDFSPRGYTTLSVDADGEVTVTRKLLGTSKRASRTALSSLESLPKTLSGSAAPVKTGSAWPQFHGNAARDGVSSETPLPPYDRVWQTRLPGGLLFGSPLIVDDNVYIAVINEENAGGGKLVCLDAKSGELKWEVPTHGSVKHTPVVWGSLVICINVTGVVKAVDAETGIPVWVRELGDPSPRWVFSAPLLTHDLIITGSASCFVALDAETGRVMWRREDLGTDWISSYISATADDKSVYIGFFWHQEVAFALDLITGQTRWVTREPARTGPAATLVLDGEGSLYATCHDGYVRAYSTADGSPTWQHDLCHPDGDRSGPKWSAGTPALAGKTLCVPTGEGTVRGLDIKNGRELWRWEAEESLAGIQAYTRDGRSVLSSPVIVGNVAVVGSSDGRLVALDVSSGKLIWSDDLEAPVVSSPAVSGNLMVCGACDGWLYAWTSQ